jgi:hypothetical protein
MCHIAPESVSQRLDRQHDCGLRARNPPAQSPKSLKERGQVKEPAAPAYLQLCRARGQCKTANSSCQMKVLAFAATADLAGGEWLSYDKVSQAPPSLDGLYYWHTFADLRRHFRCERILA